MKLFDFATAAFIIFVVLSIKIGTYNECGEEETPPTPIITTPISM